MLQHQSALSNRLNTIDNNSDYNMLIRQQQQQHLNQQHLQSDSTDIYSTTNNNNPQSPIKLRHQQKIGAIDEYLSENDPTSLNKTSLQKPNDLPHIM